MSCIAPDGIVMSVVFNPVNPMSWIMIPWKLMKTPFGKLIVSDRRKKSQDLMSVIASN